MVPKESCQVPGRDMATRRCVGLEGRMRKAMNFTCQVMILNLTLSFLAVLFLDLGFGMLLLIPVIGLMTVTFHHCRSSFVGFFVFSSLSTG